MFGTHAIRTSIVAQLTKVFIGIFVSQRKLASFCSLRNLHKHMPENAHILRKHVKVTWQKAHQSSFVDLLCSWG